MRRGVPASVEAVGWKVYFGNTWVCSGCGIEVRLGGLGSSALLALGGKEGACDSLLLLLSSMFLGGRDGRSHDAANLGVGCLSTDLQSTASSFSGTEG